MIHSVQEHRYDIQPSLEGGVTMHFQKATLSLLLAQRDSPEGMATSAEIQYFTEKTR